MQSHIRETLKPEFACSLLLGTRKQDHQSYLLRLNFLEYILHSWPTGKERFGIPTKGDQYSHVHITEISPVSQDLQKKHPADDKNENIVIKYSHQIPRTEILLLFLPLNNNVRGRGLD